MNVCFPQVQTPTIAQVLPEFLPGLLRPCAPAVERLLAIDKVDAMYETVEPRTPELPFFSAMLEYLNTRAAVSEDDIARVPRTGPLVVVSNHPFGIVDGTLIASTLARVRPDVKVLVNSLLKLFPAGEPHFIFVNPFGTPEAVRENLRGMKESLKHLRDGGCLIIFPAGEVSHLRMGSASVSDSAWNESVGRLIRAARCSVLPAFVKGRNSSLFQALGLIHPRLRTLMLGRELVNKRAMRVELRFGNPLPAKRLEGFPSDKALIDYLRLRTDLLAKREQERPKPVFFPRFPSPKQEPIIEPVDSILLKADVTALPANRKLVQSGEMQVFVAKSHELPNVFREIGRLREITFREAGEGTGASIDIDTYDAHYLQLFIWNSATSEVVGGYRLGLTDEIRARFGKSGLYTSSLFAYQESFLDRLGPALEMGRSFVRLEYQRSYAPLLLLWRGIGEFCVRNPRYRKLFGPVSISNNYHPVSRQLMVTFFKALSQAGELSGLVRAKNPLRRGAVLARAEAGKPFCWDIEELNAMLADIETDQKGVPVLLRQYLKLGGRLLSFNMDRSFANALDGLILVDLDKTEPKLLERYMGREGARGFLSQSQTAAAASR